MALEGFLQEFGLADILQLIYFQRKTGILYIEGKMDKVELSFINGNIAGLKSQRRPEGNRLGKILIRKGLITSQDFENAMEIQKTEHVKLGNILIRKGLVPKDGLMEIIHEQIIETIVQIFSWKEGRYEFDPQEVPVDKELPVSLDTQHLLMDGLRLVDEWTLIEGKLDLNTIYNQVREPEPGELNDLEKEVLGVIDGDRDVSTIIETCYSGDYETSRAIISLEEKGIVEHIAIQPLEKEKIGTTNEPGYPFYLAIAGVLLIVLIFIFKGSFDAFKVFRDAKSGFQIEKLKTEIDIYHATNGRYPHALEVITNENDLWGRPYEYSSTESGFKLFSPGPDGIRGTEDDVY